jgi:hypothetical protein
VQRRVSICIHASCAQPFVTFPPRAALLSAQEPLESSTQRRYGSPAAECAAGHSSFHHRGAMAAPLPYNPDAMAAPLPVPYGQPAVNPSWVGAAAYASAAGAPVPAWPIPNSVDATVFVLGVHATFAAPGLPH